jgi:hypothetical protein
MANALYPKFKEAALKAGVNLESGNVKVALVDLGTYTYSAAHEFYSSVTSAVVGTPQALASKTFTNGVFDAADSTIPAVTGNTVEALVIYVDSGSAATSPLVAFFDTGVTGLPFTPNGGAANITWNASGIFQL